MWSQSTWFFCYTDSHAFFSPWHSAAHSFLTYVICWVPSSLGFHGMISLGEGKGKTNSSKSQIKVGSEFVISSAHKYSSKLTCYPSGQSKKAHILTYYEFYHQSSRNNSAQF